MTTINILRSATLSALLLAAGCGVDAGNACDCEPGMHCNDAMTGCVPDPGGDGGAAADLSVIEPATCTPPCSGGAPHCTAGHRCVACLTDDHCGAGSFCGADGSCVFGCKDDTRCQAGGAAASNRCCAMACTDTAGDTMNCGGCGMACQGGHSQVTCVAGQCKSGTCEAGWGDCNMDPSDGCETNFHVDPLNCTGCGMKCDVAQGYAACANGCYIRACTYGWEDCNDTVDDGCEVSVMSDAQNCGACGKVCPAPPHASAACVNLGCTFGKCNNGYADCDGNAKNGCESYTQFDDKNCSACGKPCPKDNPFCDGGKCVQVAPNKIIFITSQTYDGNLGGLAGADEKCQTLANAAGVAGSFLAWLSDAMNSPNTRMTHSDLPYVLVDKTLVANNWADLTSGEIQHAINLTEKGGAGPAGNVACPGPTIWSNTSANGNAGGSNCNFWTSNGNVSSNWGQQNVTDSTWSSWCSGGTCTWVDPFLCVQQ